VDWVRHESGVPVGYWRSVAQSHNPFAVESFLDEVAVAGGKDPVELRRQLLAGRPRHLAVLELAARRGGWGSPMGPGRGRGIAMQESFGSIVAHVAEVTVAGGEVRVDRVVCAADCGTVVNPNLVAQQMEGGILFALSAVLHEEITIAEGRVRQRNLTDYPLLRFSEAPVLEVHLVPSTEAPGGVGEPGVAPLAPAVVNAVFAATGRRVRRLPIRLSEK
jgi:isoquinoline 1-oxidoreductase beta subunit